MPAQQWGLEERRLGWLVAGGAARCVAGDGRQEQQQARAQHVPLTMPQSPVSRLVKLHYAWLAVVGECTAAAGVLLRARVKPGCLLRCPGLRLKDPVHCKAWWQQDIAV